MGGHRGHEEQPGHDNVRAAFTTLIKKEDGWTLIKVIEVLMENQPGVVVSPVKVGNHDEQQKRGDLG